MQRILFLSKVMKEFIISLSPTQIMEMTNNYIKKYVEKLKDNKKDDEKIKPFSPNKRSTW